MKIDYFKLGTTIIIIALSIGVGALWSGNTQTVQTTEEVKPITRKIENMELINQDGKNYIRTFFVSEITAEQLEKRKEQLKKVINESNTIIKNSEQELINIDSILINLP